MKRNKLNSKVKYYTSGLLSYVIKTLTIRTSSELILIYTMAKVGSTSFYAIFKKGIFSPVFHFHTLNLESHNKNVSQIRKQGLYPDSWTNAATILQHLDRKKNCVLYTSPSPRDRQKSRMPSSA